MRKLPLSLLSLAALSAAVVLTGCKKEDTLNISRIKNFPAITLNGAAITSINLNETFADPGATATLNGSAITPVVRGNLNNRVLGFYTIVYKGANTEGDTVQTSRIVAVVDPAVNNLDQSGTFARSSNGVPSVVTKISKGLYQTSNFGGVVTPSTFAQPAYFAQLTATRILFPTQVVPGIGTVSFTGQTPVFVGTQLRSYAYVVVNPSFGTAVRTFVRQ